MNTISSVLRTLIVAFVFLLLPGDGWSQTTLFHTEDSGATRYRIPSIVQLHSGELRVFADHRYATGDIGSGRIDVVSRKQNADGTWGDETTVLRGCFGDAATVVDRESGALLMINASGQTAYGASTTDNPIRIARSVSTDGGDTWCSEDITSRIYADCLGNKWAGVFFTSGRICQSRIIKTGNYYRLYAALCARNSGGNASIVVYSDDFGNTWRMLGNVAVDGGDEAKTVELPNGNVLVSARVNGNTGRYFNIFSYTSAAAGEGCWGKQVLSAFYGCNSCNGELLLVPTAGAEGNKAYMLLQSVALGARENVSIYNKVLYSSDDYDEPADFLSGWMRHKVSYTSSAYSTMILLRNDSIAFLYEENSKNSGYDIRLQTIKSPPLPTPSSE